MKIRSEDEIALNDKLLAGWLAETGRSCGECSMCCKLLPIDEPELTKPGDKWCQHCRPGAGGCSIYKDRPPVCRGFACQWLIDATFGDEWKPSRSKIVVHMKPLDDGQLLDSNTKAMVRLNFVVDCSVPNRWREPFFYRGIKSASHTGLHGRLGYFFETRVEVGNRHWLILPNKDVELTGTGGHFMMPIGDDEWEVKTFESEEKARDFYQKMMGLQKEMDKMIEGMSAEDRAGFLEALKQAARQGAGAVK